MKSFRKLVSEVAQPKAGDEARFKAKHVVDPKEHPVADDLVFTGGTVRSPKRRADREKGEDAAVYEGSFNVPSAAGGEHDSEDSHQKYKKGNKSSKTMKEAKKMDPVGREDDDIDNDGDVDSSDKYLHARRRAISKAIKKEATDTQMGTITVTSDEERKKRAQMYRDKKAASVKKEEVDQVDEVKDGLSAAVNRAEASRQRALKKAAAMVKKGFSHEVAARNHDVKVNDLKRHMNEEVELEEAKSWFMQSDHDDFAKMTPEERKDRHQRLLKLTKHSDSHIRSFAKAAANEFKSKYMNEEVEQVDEVSKKTAISAYRKRQSHADDWYSEPDDQKKADATLRRISKNFGSKTTGDAQRGVDIDRKGRGPRDVGQDYLFYKQDTYDRLAKPGTKKGTAQRKDYMKLNKGTFKKPPRFTEEVEQVDEVLKSTTPMGTWIKDFQKSKAPQFKGKSQEKRRQMAIAAKYGAEREAGMREEVELDEDAWEEVPMMMSQLEFICYAAEEIMDYLDMGIDPEEWYQNKLANVYHSMMSLYSYARGEMRMSSRSVNGYDDMYGEEVEQIDELSQDTLRSYHAKAGLDLRKKREKLDKGTLTSKDYKQGQNRVTGLNRSAARMEEVESDKPITKSRLNTDLSEVTHSAVKKTVTYIDAKGHSRARNVPIKRTDHDEYGQDKIKESIELVEVFNQGIVKLKDGGSVILKKEDADLLNQMFKDLSSANRKKMQEIAMKDKAGFNEILSFAREAL